MYIQVCMYIVLESDPYITAYFVALLNLIHLLILHRDPLAADDGSKKKTAQPSNADHVEIMKLMTSPCGGS